MSAEDRQRLRNLAARLRDALTLLRGRDREVELLDVARDLADLSEGKEVRA